MDGTTHVLIIAERPDDAQMLHDALHEAPPESGVYAVARAPLDGDAEMADVPDARTDIVLLDVVEQSDAGLATLRRIRAQAPDVPVVVRVGAGIPFAAFTARAAEHGARDVMRSDVVDPAVLRRMLRYALERERLHDTLRQLALSDELTGLYNRRGFFALADHHRRLAHRTRGLLLAVIDVDGLRAVNDRHGRADGDRVLCAAAAVLRDTFRASDVIARMAGDDFAVLVPDAAPDAETVLAERLRRRLADHNAAHAGQSHALALTMGLARAVPGDAPAIEELLVQARDQAAAQERR
jgi:two-component system cell cycle response regulator